MTPRAHRRQSGMTLIELVVALGLLALLVAALAGALGVSARGSVLVETRAEQGEALRIAQSTLRRYLAQARPVRTIVNQRDQVVFAGVPDGLGFIAVMPPWPSGGGLYVVRIALEEAGGSRALVLTRQPTAGEGAALDAGAERAVLVQGVAGLRWSYFGVDEGARQGSWRPDWRGRNELPKLVRLELQFADPGMPAWPPLIVGLPLDAGPR
ncbi:MAG: prepilin-type N-terminal cleavage/methylation domain-containing protein [Alphaproteobacteria bacterium]|nr:prepilin-type N-terminal cleavage/methylation domain-containing protein [Alphaproteobacteria bacterium]